MIDILRHLPRSTLSDQQNSMIVWMLRSLGLNSVPGNSSMKTSMKLLQSSCGIGTKQYKGALGHIYYVNNFLRMISQEMANPFVRPYLHFFPEVGSNIAAVYQSEKWLSEMDSAPLSPMVQLLKQVTG